MRSVRFQQTVRLFGDVNIKGDLAAWLRVCGVQDTGDRDESEKQALQPWMSGEKTVSS